VKGIKGGYAYLQNIRIRYMSTTELEEKSFYKLFQKGGFIYKDRSKGWHMLSHYKAGSR